MSEVWTIIWFPLCPWDEGSVCCEDCPLMLSVWWPGFVMLFSWGFTSQRTLVLQVQGIMSNFDTAVLSSNAASNTCVFQKWCPAYLSLSRAWLHCLEDPRGKPIQLIPAAFIYEPAVLSCAKGLHCRCYKEQLPVAFQPGFPHRSCCICPGVVVRGRSSPLKRSTRTIRWVS